jgi:cell division transport system ATP-binding protein
LIITLDLCLKRGAHEIIDGLNLHIERGEFVFICGQAGSGKTTLLRILALQQKPAGGRVIVEGRDINDITRREFPEYMRGLGVIFRDDMLLPQCTLAENITISLELAGWRAPDARKEMIDYLRRVGLYSKATLFPDQISENEKQMLKICRALVRRPKIVLADEPYEGLDSHSIEKAIELFENANLRGSTIVSTTHNVELVRQLGKRAIMLDRTSFGRMANASSG